MNFLDVFNIVADSVGNKPANAPKATSYDNDPIDVGLDSLDMIMIVEVILCATTLTRIKNETPCLLKKCWSTYNGPNRSR